MQELFTQKISLFIISLQSLLYSTQSSKHFAQLVFFLCILRISRALDIQLQLANML